MPKSLQRPVVLLTGASSGIGYDVAPLLVRYGYTVYGAARRVEKIEELASEGVKALSMDVTDEASMEAAVQQIIDAEGRIDVLINNAGYGSYGAIEDVPIDEARRQFEVNLFGLARLTQLVLPHMRARGSGRILNISSMAGRITSPLGAWYHATKYAHYRARRYQDPLGAHRGRPPGGVLPKRRLRGSGAARCGKYAQALLALLQPLGAEGYL